MFHAQAHAVLIVSVIGAAALNEHGRAFLPVEPTGPSWCDGRLRAGCEPPARVARPDVHVDRTIGEDGTVLAWFVSDADDARVAAPHPHDGARPVRGKRPRARTALE